MKHIKWDFSLKILIQSPGLDLGLGSRPKLNFFEYGHVAYQIKANHACSNMVANILPTDTLDPGDGVKRSFSFLF